MMSAHCILPWARCLRPSRTAGNWMGRACATAASFTRLTGAPVTALVADGWTPHRGRVKNQSKFGAFIDFGCERPGLLPLRKGGAVVEDSDTIRHLGIGEYVDVYVVGRTKGTGKVTLSLVPCGRPQVRWDQIVADGCTPYQGRVANLVDYGAFIDIGAEVHGLLPLRSLQQKAEELSVGDLVTVYVHGKREDSSKLTLSLDRRPCARVSWDDLVADGHTPHAGIVTSVDAGFGAFVDIGCMRDALLPRREVNFGNGSATDPNGSIALEKGSNVTVYVVRKQRKTRKIVVSLQRHIVPLKPFDEIIADGQTPIRGVVMSKQDYGALVDIGCEEAGLVHRDQWLDDAEFKGVAAGDQLTLYVLAKSRDTGKILLGLRRCEKPRESWAAIVSDGQTPYLGKVTNVSWYGVFVDIGCERIGRLMRSEDSDERLRSVKVGDGITVYVTEKRTETGKMTLSLDPSDVGLKRVDELVVDGQTGYRGRVRIINDLGVWVDVGSDRSGVLWRSRLSPSDLASVESMTVGDPVLVYISRRNPSTGRLQVSLTPSPTPRKSLAEVLRTLGSATHEGVIYHMQHEWIHLDIHSEVAGALSRREAPPDCIPGDRLTVRVLDFDHEKGRFKLAHAPGAVTARMPVEPAST